MFSRYSKRSLLKSKKKCSQESKRNRSKNIKSEEEKLVCKGKFETWTEFLTFRLFLNV